MRLSLLALVPALAAVMAIAPVGSVLAASKHTVRASGVVTLREGPGSRYRVIGKLRDGARFHLETCTPDSEWCLVLNKDGDELGWALGSYLVGFPAKTEVTESDFFRNPTDPFHLFDGR